MNCAFDRPQLAERNADDPFLAAPLYAAGVTRPFSLQQDKPIPTANARPHKANGLS